MEILYTSDNCFVPQIAASICSVCENNRDQEAIHFHIFCYHYSDENIDKLTSFVERYSRSISFYDINNLKQYFPYEFDTGGWKPIVLSRLLCYKILPESIERVLYLDGDTIIRGSLNELWSTDFCGCSVAGVIEPTVNKKNLEAINLAGQPYINAGVLLINNKKWREDNVGDTLLMYYQKKHKELFANDQDAINGSLKDDILYISPKYNFCNSFYTYNYEVLCKIMHPTPYIEKDVFQDAYRNPVIIHYLGEERPWRMGNRHKYRDDFTKYLSLTPWKDTEFNEDWRLYFTAFYTFNFLMKLFPLFRYRIITYLIPVFIRYRARKLKKNSID